MGLLVPDPWLAPPPARRGGDRHPVRRGPGRARSPRPAGCAPPDRLGRGRGRRHALGFRSCGLSRDPASSAVAAEPPRAAASVARGAAGASRLPRVSDHPPGALGRRPEYDRVAPPLAKPVRPGLQALANGSLLQRYALAVGVGRMTLVPVESAAAALGAGDEEGGERLRAALGAWPAGLRRQVYARFRHMEGSGSAAAAEASEMGKAAAGRRPVSTISARSSRNSGPSCLRNPDLESHLFRSEPAAAGLSNSGRPTPSPAGRRAD